ncbi:dihydrofolate reductase family protein [Pseudonocardia sp. N23]|uniref:dihydrofolate reductase family protein n=1 Tax=Pseudonocardia sp. N23 TaxID=1987376 RepID=UPI000BFD0A8B|nr:dihydrofolate reductase family protein [Pseudonocardia sp. N23]GAY09325.1 dihydrofolate reductase [Pseudonocardia sp. N23]
MTGKLRVSVAVSLDGHMAGPDQTLEAPLGTGGERLHQWMFPTRSFRAMVGEEGGTTGLDDEYVVAAAAGLGATIMGRNMFGPIRGEWPDDSWTGWWGPEPPYHHPVFVLTHHEREPVTMEGGTTFHFVTGGIEDALEQARAAAGDADIRIGGGAETVRQYLRAGLVDSMHLAVSGVLLGAGERPFDGVSPDGYVCTGVVASGTVAHMRFERA